MADEALTRIGAMLEELGARFELVVEAVSGYGGRIDKLKEEIFGQFAEVGSQIRFLSDQIAENRSGLASLRTDLGAEMIRLGEAIGKTRVEFREQLSTTESALRGEIATQFEATRVTAQEQAIRTEAAVQELSSQPVAAGSPAAEGAGREVAAALRDLRREISASADATAKKLAAEVSKTNKTLANLSRKFERFDDKITVQVKDHEQRLKKVESSGRR